MNHSTRRPIGPVSVSTAAGPSRPHALGRRRFIAAAASLGAGAFATSPVRAAASEVVVGQSVHLGGPLGPTIAGVMRGQNLAVENVNRNGGINGKTLRIVTLDDEYDAKRTVENSRRLIEEQKVVALFAPGSTAAMIGLIPLVNEKKIPVIGTYSGNPTVREKHQPYMFFTTASYKDEVVQMMRNLVALQRMNIGVCYQDTPFGDTMKPIVDAAAADAGIKVVSQTRLDLKGAEATSCAQALAAGKPQAILFMAFGPCMVPFVKAARAHVGAPMYCISVGNIAPILQALGDDARGLAFTQVVPYPWRATTPIARDFHAEIKAAGVEPAYDVFHGYLNVRVLAAGLRRAGRSVTPASVVNGMESLNNVDIGGYRLHFSKSNHNGSQFVEQTIVGPNGRYMR